MHNLIFVNPLPHFPNKINSQKNVDIWHANCYIEDQELRFGNSNSFLPKLAYR